jgi:hypothetical protein
MSNNNQLTLANLSLLNSTKAERKAFVEEVMTQLEEGNHNPLQFHVNIKNMEGILKAFTDKKDSPAIAERYSKLLLDEAAKHGKKFELYNAEFQTKEAGTVYDWSVCQDPKIEALLIEQEVLKAKIKERQEFLKTIPNEGIIVTDEQTGETITIYKPSKSSTTTVSVTIK